MAANDFGTRRYSTQKSYTTPHESETSSSSSVEYRRGQSGRHSLTAPMSSTSPPPGGGYRNTRTTYRQPGPNEGMTHHPRQYEGGHYDNSGQPNSFPRTHQHCDSWVDDQPYSFPMSQQHQLQSRHSSSLEPKKTSDSSYSQSTASPTKASGYSLPHSSKYNQDTGHKSTHQSPLRDQFPDPSASVPAPHRVHGGISSSQSLSHSSHSGDFHHAQQQSRSNPSYGVEPVRAGVRGREEGRTAGSMPHMRNVCGAEHLRDIRKPSSDFRGTSSDSKSGTRHSPELSGDQHAIPRSPSSENCSQATLENARYSLDKIPTSDHSNEDRYFAVEGAGFKAFCVCDGHNGSRASGFASNYLMKMFYQEFWKNVVSRSDSSIICEALQEFFMDTEKEFFRSIERFVKEKESLQAKIPQHLTSYAAYQQYPYEVMKLQEVEPKLNGGCTAVLAVIINDKLYVVNVGDSRALLVREEPNGILVAEQLTIDHTVENEDELKRLELLGLVPQDLLKAGRLGTQENTRSIGDYSIKAGYKDVDCLRSARYAPGTAKPYIMPTMKINPSFKYLILMTDGVYKSIESNFVEQSAIDVNKVLVNMMERSLKTNRHFESLSDNVLERIATINQDCYKESAKKDGRSPRAIACRKRDDMTLVVYKFPELTSMTRI